MKKYQYILLDWDGNLAKTLDVWLDVARTVLEKRGVTPSDRDIGTSFGAFRAMWKDWGVDDADDALHEANELAKDALPNAELYPDAIEVLEELHSRGKKLALITTSHYDHVQPLLKKYNLDSLFEVVITGDNITHHKPHPESLEKALSAIGGTRDGAIMIGDSDKDIGAANNMGIDSILFHSSAHTKFYDIEELKELKPTYIVENFLQVLDIV